LIVNGESGLLVAPGNPMQLGTAVERLLADPPFAERLGRAGQSAAFGPGGWPEAARHTVALYQRLLR
jgi:hypothetical protein